MPYLELLVVIKKHQVAVPTTWLGILNWSAGTMHCIPEHDIEDVASFLGPLAPAVLIVQRPRRLFPVEDAAVHGLVDAGAGSSYRCGTDGCRTFNRLRIDTHWRIFAADGKVSSCNILFVISRPRFGSIFLRRMQELEVVSWLD